MDKWQALDKYWNRYGVPAYNELTVPEDAPDKHIIYQSAVGRLNGRLTLSGSLFDYGPSWTWIMQKATEMQTVMECQIPIDGGYVMFRIPDGYSAQPQSDPNDPQVRRIIFTVEVEFLSN